MGGGRLHLHRGAWPRAAELHARTHARSRQPRSPVPRGGSTPRGGGGALASQLHPGSIPWGGGGAEKRPFKMTAHIA